jgi:VanZ family protein
MFKLVGKLSQQIWLALAWTTLTQVLLSLPGKLFSGGGLFNIPFLDKIAHLILFSGLVICWCLFFYYRKRPPAIAPSLIWLIVFLTLVYGILLEFFQKNFIPNRSFDRGDIVADLAGSLIGYLVTHWFLAWNNRRALYKKN